MQSVNATFTAEERDEVRSVGHSLLASWKKSTNLNNRTFTIGVSLIGGTDIIGINPGSVGSPGIYEYDDESAYVQSLAWERGLSVPVGGLSVAQAEAILDNTSGRFTPRYMGGSSELFTAILPRRPIVINAGFKVNGIDQMLPQFAGILNRQPQVNTRSKQLGLQASDYVDFFRNRELDQEAMFTGLRTDEVYDQLLQSMGLPTSQYELDVGLNRIPFGIFDRGTKYQDIFHQLAEAENGYFYQDESGVFRFENRQHWDSSPHTEVQRILMTAQVLDSEAPDEDHIINVVEIKSDIIEKQINQTVYTLGEPIPLSANSDTSFFVDFDDPILELDTPTGWQAFVNEDGTGANITGSVSLRNIDAFARSAKITFTNSGVAGFLTLLNLTGRPAKVVSELYYRDKTDSSVTAFEERVLTINNPYIQNLSWANSLSQMILQDYAVPENLQQITIRAIPELQLGDLVSWQGVHWRVFNIKARLDPSEGFAQDLMLLKREARAYFRIGVSTIGSTDAIAP